jgi:uncharacterized protein (TIGR03086 family)
MVACICGMDTVAVTEPLEATLLDEGFAWTAARIAAIPADALDAPTPCGSWTLRELLDHTLGTVGAFADALAARAPERPITEPPAPVAGERTWSVAFAELAGRIQRGWTDPEALGRTYELPFGTMPGPVMASANLLEVVVHGWDIAQATGEAVDIPDELARPILAFAQAAIGDDGRGDAFGPALGGGGTPGEQLIAFLGRTPR